MAEVYMNGDTNIIEATGSKNDPVITEDGGVIQRNDMFDTEHLKTLVKDGINKEKVGNSLDSVLVVENDESNVNGINGSYDINDNSKIFSSTVHAESTVTTNVVGTLDSCSSPTLIIDNSVLDKVNCEIPHQETLGISSELNVVNTVANEPLQDICDINKNDKIDKATDNLNTQIVSSEITITSINSEITANNGEEAATTVKTDSSSDTNIFNVNDDASVTLDTKKKSESVDIDVSVTSVPFAEPYIKISLVDDDNNHGVEENNYIYEELNDVPIAISSDSTHTTNEERVICNDSITLDPSNEVYVDLKRDLDADVPSDSLIGSKYTSTAELAINETIVNEHITDNVAIETTKEEGVEDTAVSNFVDQVIEHAKKEDSIITAEAISVFAASPKQEIVVDVPVIDLTADTSYVEPVVNTDDVIPATKSVSVETIGALKSMPNEIIDDAKPKSVEFIDDVKSEAVESIDDVKSEAMEIIDDSESEAVEIIDDVKSEPVEIIDDIKSEPVQIIDDGKAASVESIDDGKAEPVKIIEEGKATSVEIVADIKSVPIEIIDDGKSAPVEVINDSTAIAVESIDNSKYTPVGCIVDAIPTSIDTVNQSKSVPDATPTPFTIPAPIDTVNESISVPEATPSTTSTTEKSKENVEDSEPPEDEWLDILGNGLLKKKVILKGIGNETRPKPGNIVTIKCEGRLANGVVVDKHENLQFILSEEDVIQAFDLAVALMEDKEVATVFTDARYAYGIRGRSDYNPPIPQNASITYEIEVLSVVEGPVLENMTSEERVLNGDKKRIRGNDLYGKEEYAASINSYKRGIKYLEGTDNKDVMDMKIKCLNNLSAAQLKVKAYKMAIQSLDTVLQFEPENVKALFRKGKCLDGLKKEEEALEYIKKASMLDPQNKSILQELGRLRSRVAVTHQKEKEIYQKMFQPKKEEKITKEEEDLNWSVKITSAVVGVLGIIAGLLWYKHR